MNAKLAPASILIVDDDEDDRWLMGQAFDQVCPHLQKVFACNGEEAEHWLQSSSYPLFIVTDLNMPKVSGVELVERLKHHPYYRTIPIVICTTSLSEEDRERSYLAGVNAFVTKPVRLTDLEELVRSLVSVWLRQR